MADDRLAQIKSRVEAGAFLADIRWLIAQLERYVDTEPTVAEEMSYLSSCLDAVRAVCDQARQAARPGDQPVPEPEWIAAVEQAANGNRPDDPADRRRRIYIDGKGRAWMSQDTDPVEGELIAPLGTNPFDHGEPARKVQCRTGALREIGRTW
ncbi:hypothetical protein ACH4GK_17645 [Streptomyces rimosus]|uniref:hypothetical protein n=1 Tax=Streptomyces rimosus TaxID=1927 RepID=UPI0004C80E9B|nr:hypothetical protein [Streptomyces rimosus]